MCNNCSKYSTGEYGFCLECGAPLNIPVKTAGEEVLEKTSEEVMFKHASEDLEPNPEKVRKKEEE